MSFKTFDIGAPLAGRLGESFGTGLKSGYENLQKRLTEQRKQQQILDLLNPQQQQTSGQSIDPTPVGKTDPISSLVDKLSDDQITAISLKDPQAARVLQQQKQANQQQRQALRKETLPLRQEYAKQSVAARKAIDNKEQMLRLIEKGDLTNPLLAGIARFLPKGVDNLLLSSDSQLYRSILFDEFGILKQMFPGQIRTAEITLLEDKLADLYKNDEAKKKILETSLKKVKFDQIDARAASTVEKLHPNVGALQFQELVDFYAQPEREKLANEIMKDYETIADTYGPKEATLRKAKEGEKLSEDLARKIYKQAGNDAEKARKLARKLGYEF